MKAWIPTLPEIGRETLIIMAGALIAALVLSRLPTVRDFIQKNTAFGGCNCDGHDKAPAA
ncbi:MAG: hypothetical protein V4645_18145 [Pseudomonadota bacterium]